VQVLIPLLLVAQISCRPSDITQREAQALVVKIVVAGAPRVRAGAEETHSLLGSDWWEFRTFAENPAPTDISNLMGWVSINKRTAEISDPVSGSQIIIPAAVHSEQQRLRKIHCLH
jgi:hypothetical protein